jgi:TDG/mug DNA glycosylase family protein
MSTIQSFAAIADKQAKILILGSMPGEASLRAGEYYAHTRNHFWRIMAALFALDYTIDYKQRIKALKSAHIALWDVLQSCEREGSLDSNIDKTTQVPNDFASFFATHPAITHVFFNGSKAEQVYLREVLPALNLPDIVYLRLPSTSPANAAQSFELKLAAWQAINTIDYMSIP